MGTPSRSSSDKEKEFREDYSSSLEDLNCNSKPLIDCLTDVAEESKEYAHIVVDCVVERLEKVADPLKLPVLYLIDSITKRARDKYLELFSKHIPRLFALVYKQGDETIRQKLSKLRAYWSPFYPAQVLSQLDRMILALDSTWPFSQPSTSIHVNPKFFAIGANVTNANGVTTTRITPVSSELIAAAKRNAEKRARDPRLRKIEQQEQTRPVVVNTNNSAASVIREAKILPPVLSTATTTTTSVPQIDAKIDQKNDRRPQLEKKQVAASKVEPKAAPVKKIVKVVKATAGKSSSRSSNSATITTPSTSGTNCTISSNSNNGSIVKVAKSSKIESSAKAKIAGSSVTGATTKTSATATKTSADTAKATAAITKTTTSSTKKTTVAATNTVRENQIAKSVSEMLKNLFNISEPEKSRDKQMERPKLSYSKEARSHALRMMAESLIDDPEGDETLATMAETYPKIVPILISLMEECKGISATVAEEKDSTNVENPKSKTTEVTTSTSSKNSATKRDKTASPKRASKTTSAPAPVTKKTSPVVASVTTSQIPLPPTTTLVSAVTSVTSPISTTAVISTSTVVEPSSPVAITVPPIIASIPIPPVITPSAPVAASTIANPVILAATTSIANLADKLVPTTLQSISVTTSATSTSASSSSPTPSTVSAAKPVSPAAPAPLSPTLPVPPPAPIISSTAAAAEQNKTQDVDYRQLFGFQILPVPKAAAAPVAVVVPEDESKMVIEVKSDDEEIEEVIDVDALPCKPEVATTSPTSSPTTTPVSTSSIKPIKRKSQDKRNYRNHKKRRTSVSSNDSDTSSRCSVDSVETSNSNSNNKRSISELSKICIEEEGSRSPGMKAKKAKSDDSFYSQTDTPNPIFNDEKPTPSNLIIMPVSESSRPKTDSPPMFPKFESNFGANFSAAVGNDYTMNAQLTTPEIPPTNRSLIEMIDDDPVRSISIDGVSREIRHYGSTAIMFMNWDDPRDISFFNGVRNVIIDDKFGIPCTLNAPEIETLVYGTKHRFRLGVPTRELYIDGRGYNCYFGGAAIRVRLDYKHNHIRLEGPPPSVNIGTVKRLDIVAGKINIIIDDQYQQPIYLDAKPQYFVIDRKPVALVFIDSLKRVLINNVPFRTDFGGPSQSFKFLGKIYQFRLTALPKGILPGINLAQMVVSKLPSPPPLPPQFQFSVSDSLPTPPMPPPVLTTAILPPAIEVEQPPKVTNNVPGASSGAGGILENISIDELFQKLVASGIVPNVDNKSEEASDTVKHVDFDKPETLKQRQPALIKMLYSGIQCGSCGLRFPAEQTIKYSQHLDWHFRLNRKGKDGARTIHSRKWYYSKTDWIKFQEMEDTTDRGTSWFDNHPVTEYTEEVLENVPCIPAGSNQNAACELCRDRFEQFYNDESDEWQLRNAIKVDELIYHPMCYSDHQQKLEQEKLEAAEKEKLAEEAEASAPVADTKTSTTEDEKPVEKSDEPSTEPPASSMDYDDDDSDVEEVRIIEQPIEEIIINDENDYDEPNLETLNTEDIIAAQQEIADEELPENVPKPIKIEDTDDDKIVDISDPAGEPACDEYIETVVDSPQTKSGPEGVVNMDGNIELLDNPAQILNTATKIKINISKNITEAHSPRPEEPKNTTNGHDNGAEEAVTENSYPIISSTSDEEKLVPVNVKSRIQDAKLNIYPAVTKGTEKSGLCSIM